MGLLITEEQLSNLDYAKQIIVIAMIKEGFITSEKGIEFLNNYAVVITKKTIWTRIYNSIFPNRNDSGVHYTVVKVIGDTYIGNKDIDDEDSLEQLKFKLAKAESDQNFELARQIQDRINKLKK